MRKVVLITALAFLGKIGVAQSESEYKLQKGSITTELQLSLFSTKVTIDEDEETINYSGPLSMPSFRLRYAFSEKWALRASVGLDFGHNSIKRDFNDSTVTSYYKEFITGKSTEKDRYTEFSIAPGIEYHFGKWERMSVYVGGEVFFGMRTNQGTSNSEKRKDCYERDWNGEFELRETIETNYSLTTKNCTYYESPYYSRHAQTGVMTFGANLLIGVDFYVYKGLYLGAELGFGYQYAMAMKGTVKGEETVKIDGVVDGEPIKVDKTFDDKITFGGGGFKCNPMIRLGWKF